MNAITLKCAALREPLLPLYGPEPKQLPTHALGDPKLLWSEFLSLFQTYLGRLLEKTVFFVFEEQSTWWSFRYDSIARSREENDGENLYQVGITRYSSHALPVSGGGLLWRRSIPTPDLAGYFNGNSCFRIPKCKHLSKLCLGLGLERHPRMYLSLALPRTDFH